MAKTRPQIMQLSWDMFGPSAMQVEGVGLHLTKLKVKQLGEELSMRGAPKQVGEKAGAAAAIACADHCCCGGGSGRSVSAAGAQKLTIFDNIGVNGPYLKFAVPGHKLTTF